MKKQEVVDVRAPPPSPIPDADEEVAQGAVAILHQYDYNFYKKLYSLDTTVNSASGTIKRDRDAKLDEIS